MVVGMRSMPLLAAPFVLGAVAVPPEEATVMLQPKGRRTRLKAAWAERGMCPGQKELGKVNKPFEELTFIHIPRTGGTSIEDCTESAASNGEQWGQKAEALQGVNSELFVKNSPQCNRQHLPPSVLDRDYYQGKNTFCVVRNPYTRLISQYGFESNVDIEGQSRSCTKEDLNSQILGALLYSQVKPPFGDCHFLPQAAYVYEWDKESYKLSTSTQHCKHVLRFEPDLKDSFNTLMGDHGYTYRLQAERNIATASSEECHFAPEDLSDDVVLLANKMFHDDFELFGYDKRVPSQPSQSMMLQSNAQFEFRSMCPLQKQVSKVNAFKKLTFIQIPLTRSEVLASCTRDEKSSSDRWADFTEEVQGKSPDGTDCQGALVPPSLWDTGYYKDKETFCVVRNPYTRLIQAGYGKKSKEELNKVLLESLNGVKKNPSWGGCYFLKQSAYVYAWDKESGTVDNSSQHCKHVLHAEPGPDLVETFNRFMQENGYIYQLPPTNEPLDYDLVPEDLSDEVVQLANEIYHDDFELLGYQKRST